MHSRGRDVLPRARVPRRVRRVGRMDATQREAAAKPRRGGAREGYDTHQDAGLAREADPRGAARVRRAHMPAHINHVLVNEYRAGEGIMPHQDGPLYTPAVAIASLGCGATMRFTPHRGVADDGSRPPDRRRRRRPRRSGSSAPRRSSASIGVGESRTSAAEAEDFASEDRLDDSIVNRESAAALVGGAGDGTEGGDAGERRSETCER